MSSQVKYPNRATVRTVIAAAIGILPLLPIVAKELGIESIPWVAAALAVTAGITRILANPLVAAWIEKYAPLLAPEPKAGKHSKRDDDTFTASSHAENLIFTPATTMNAAKDTAEKGRIVEGLIIPYGKAGMTSHGQVTAKKGSISIPADPKHVKLFRDHSNEQGSTPVGYATEIYETEQGIMAKFRVAETDDGNIALTDVREGVRDALSVELVNQQIEAGQLTAGQLTAVALVAVPAFDAARVTSVTARRHTGAANSAPGGGTVRAPGGITMKAREPEITARAIYDALTRLDDPTADQTLLTAALKQMKTAESPLGLAPQWITELWQGQPYQRRFVPHMTPRELTGLKLQGTRWKEKPAVAEWVGAGTEVHSSNASFEVVEVEAQRYAGANKLPLEWVHFGRVELIQQYFEAMAESYAQKTDIGALNAVIAAATEQDKTAASMGLIKAVALSNRLVKKGNNEQSADVFVVNDEDYFNLLDIKDRDLPALLNLIGVAPEKLIPTEHVAAGKVLAWNKNAVLHAELPGSPIRASALDVARGQTDEGVFGYAARLVSRPAGIAYVKFAG